VLGIQWDAAELPMKKSFNRGLCFIYLPILKMVGVGSKISPTAFFRKFSVHSPETVPSAVYSEAIRLGLQRCIVKSGLGAQGPYISHERPHTRSEWR
jgi:hypothetical protein